MSKLTLGQAQKVIDGVLAKALALKVPVAVAVVDDGGHLKYFVRQDGTRLINIDLAVRKAYTALCVMAPTHSIASQVRADLPSYIAMQHSNTKLTLWGGGFPVMTGGEVVGGVGVSGGLEEQDIQCCEAGLAALGGK